MNDQRPTRDSMSLEEATVSNMWEIAAIVEGLERKGLLLHDYRVCLEKYQDEPPKAKEVCGPYTQRLREIEITRSSGK